MKLRSLHPRTFSQLFEVLRENITDNLMHFHPDSIKIRATDAAKTCITYVNIFGNSLEQYECERYFLCGISVPRLFTVLRVANAEDVLEMEFVKNDDCLNIKEGGVPPPWTPCFD